MTPEEAVVAKSEVCSKNLLTTFEFDMASPAAVAKESNGIGPDRWSDAVRGASTAILSTFALPALIHDWEFGQENDGTLERWHEANSRFLANCLLCVEKNIAWWRPLRRQLAKAVAHSLYAIVESDAGKEAWMQAYSKKLNPSI